MLFPACGLFRAPAGPHETATPAAPDAPASGAPFATREPEVYRAEIVVVTPGAGSRRTFVARSGARRRADYDFGAPQQLTRLETDRVYLVYAAAGVFAEAEAPTAAPADEWQEFLTTEWLNAKTSVKFDKLETAGNLTRYRAVAADGAASEALLWVDETAGLPVKQEFYSAAGGARTLVMSVELSDLRMDADEGLFAVPAGYRRVPAEELRRLWRAGATR